MISLDNEFEKTTQLLFGKGISNMDVFSTWLTEYSFPGKEIKTAIDKKPFYIVPDYFLLRNIPINRIISDSELSKLPDIKLDFGRITLSSILRSIADIGYYNLDVIEGQNNDVENGIVYMNVYNVKSVCDVFESKHVGYSQYIYGGDHLFGCYRLFFSQFSIHCYNSTNITSCFECDSCKECTWCYFCHNCQGCHDCLFCSNARNKRYAIFNQEVGKEKYLEIKKMLLEEVITSLEKNKRFDKSIFDF